MFLAKTQKTFTCLKSTTEALEKRVKYVQMFKVNNKNTRMRSLTLF